MVLGAWCGYDGGMDASDAFGVVKERAAAVGGVVLAGATRLTAAVRPAEKPLHPRGVVVRARLERRGVPLPVGVPFLDEPGSDEVLVRLSRAVGLPEPLPDFHGLAVRVPRPDGGAGDLLFATTGAGKVTRFLLTVSRSPGGRPMTTLLPYRTPTGLVLLGARVVQSDRVLLSCASGAGPWQDFGELDLSGAGEGDPTISFDPVCNQIPGLQVPRWVQRLREPAYLQARRSRR